MCRYNTMVLCARPVLVHCSIVVNPRRDDQSDRHDQSEPVWEPYHLLAVGQLAAVAHQVRVDVQRGRVVGVRTASMPSWYDVGVCRLTFETDGLKVMYFQGVETRCFQRGFKLMCSTCTAQPRRSRPLPPCSRPRSPRCMGAFRNQVQFERTFSLH